MRILIGILLVAAASFAGEPPGDTYENPRWGYKLKVPKDWRETAVSADTPWLASKHLGKRELEGRVEDRDYMTMETPELWVLGFPHAEGDTTNPYRDYRAYIERDTDFINFGDGYEFVSESETTVDGAKVSVYELRLGKKKRIGRRVVTWVFHFDDIDFAVQFKVLEWHYDDYKSSFRGCLKSFRRIERTKSLGGGDTPAVTQRADLDAIPASKRDRTFKDAAEAGLKRAVEALPDGWRDDREKRFLLVTNADDAKFVRGAVQHTNAVLDHLDKLFGATEKGYVPPFILRIFATDEQWNAYGRKNEASDAIVRDIAIWSGKGYVRDNSLEELNQALWSLWQQERHPALEKTLPDWFQEGFKKYMRLVRTKGRRIVYAHDDWDRDEIRLQIKKGKTEPLLAILSRGIYGRGESNGGMDGSERERQVRTVVTWLMRKGNRGKQKGILRDLVTNTVAAREKAEADWTRANPRDEKKETAADWLARRRGEIDGQRLAILRAAWDATFGDWQDKDWDRLHKNWLSHAK